MAEDKAGISASGTRVMRGVAVPCAGRLGARLLLEGAYLAGQVGGTGAARPRTCQKVG